MLKERSEARDVDHGQLMDHLARAETHVAAGEQILTRQRDLIALLERNGSDTTTARKLLEQLVRCQENHLADRARFLAELYSSD